MRIAFTGAHGTGKSTIVEPLARELDLVELSTPGRWLKQQGIGVNTEASVSSQAIGWFLQYGYEHSSRDWISSRCMLDVLAYAAVPAEGKELSVVDHHLLEQMTSATRSHLLSGAYDVLFYLPPRIPLVADDVRIDDQEFQSATDQFIYRKLTEWGVSFVEIDVTDASAGARIQEIVGRVRLSQLGGPAL